MIELSGLPGREFPGGTYTITAKQDRMVRRLLGAEPSADGTAHPIYGYIATRVGCGLSVEDILAVAGAKPEDGPMVGTLELEFHSPLPVNTTYEVSGRFASIERKEGRRAGVFDLLRFELRLTAPRGEPAVTCTQSWILPRRNG